MASPKRERRRQRKAEAELVEPPLELAGLVICDRCGLLQPYRSVGFDDDDGLYEWIIPCDGPLGLECDSETAVWADDFAS